MRNVYNYHSTIQSAVGNAVGDAVEDAVGRQLGMQWGMQWGTQRGMQWGMGKHLIRLRVKQGTRSGQRRKTGLWYSTEHTIQYSSPPIIQYKTI